MYVNDSFDGVNLWEISTHENIFDLFVYYNVNLQKYSLLCRHADGSIKFWDASAGTLQVLYKLKTSKVFEKPPNRSQDGSEEDPFAVHLLSLCPESRKLAIAGAAGYVVLFKFKKQESTSETVVRFCFSSMIL